MKCDIWCISDLSHELHKVLDAAMLLLQKTKRAIDSLGFENKRFTERESSSLANVAELRIRHNLQQILAAQLQQQLQLLQMRQAEFRLQIRKKITRQIKIGRSQTLHTNMNDSNEYLIVIRCVLTTYR